MGLLHWCILAPEGPSNLAAVRFAAPIRVSSIRIFPNGTQPFANSPEVVAHTEPEAFFLEIFFNAHAISQADSKEKQRAANALIPTVIAYAGGHVDFTVDMGTEYATRLMIVKGKFEALSMAIYGEIVSDPPPVQKYEPKTLPSVDSVPLSRAVDPSNSSDPTLLAKQLLSLIPDSPPLPLIVRLMFCMKPSNEDWELPGFPYIHANLGSEVEQDFDLQSAIRWTYRPVQDDTSFESLSRFAVRVASCIGPKNSDQAFHVAKLLSISASQHPDMARTLLLHIDLASIFDVQTLDEDTLLFLLDAVANVDIARELHADFFTVILHEIQGSARVSKPTQLVARRLFARIRGWHFFEDALSNTRGDFNKSSSMLRDIGTEEQSMGIWLESMMIHDDIVTKLAENPVLPVPLSNPPYAMNIASHDDYITLVRAYIGVASVLSVFAWTDSLGNDVCREHTLAVLHLWQKVDGYREIVNHLLLLRQLTRRLEWISRENDPPRKSGVLAERVLSDLAKDPHAILHDDLVQAILTLEPPLSVIADNERLSMRKIALVAEDGLSAAVEEIMFSSDHPLSLRRLRTLRVSLAIVERELKDSKDEWRILQIFWEEQDRGIVPRLVELLGGVSDDLNGHFALPLPRMNQTLVEQLFRTADDLIRLIMHLGPAFPMTSRDMRNLTSAVADIFACTDAADMTYAQTSSACISAQATRQTCLDLVRSMSGPESYADPGRLGAEVVMRTLLEHGGQHGERDPAYHLLQVFTMIDHILPEPTLDGEDEPSYWVTSVLPNILNEMKSFFRCLDVDNQVHFVKTLVKLDNGVTGIGEWLLMQELRYLSGSLQSLLGPMRADYRLVLYHQVTLSLHFIVDLVVPSSSSSTWCLTSISSTPDLAQALKTCLVALLDGHYTSLHFRRLVSVLSTSSHSFAPELRFSILLASLRVAQRDPVLPGAFEAIMETLRNLPTESVQLEALRLELGQTFSTFAQHELDSETSEALLSIFEWLTEHENKKFMVLPAITSAAFTKLCESMHPTLPTDKADTLSTLRLRFTIDEDEFFTPTPIELVETLDLSLQNIEDLLRNDVPTPSTPKGNKTPDILGVVISPPTAILRSPATTGLTKTYTNNDFRQLRQIPSAKQNMSRLPSMHVDDFEVNTSTIVPSDMFQGQLQSHVL